MSEPTMRILSLGAGVQSTTLALMACDGTLPGLDAVIFADTGWEPPSVYRQVELLSAEFERAGIEFHVVTSGDLRAESINPDAREGRKAFAAIPYYVRHADGTRGMGQRQCTAEYKLAPIKRKVRELLGYVHPTPVPKGVFAEQWIGFSSDEIHRVRSRLDVNYSRPRYPLIELGMTRKDCERWLKRRGWGHTAKSACIGCPFHGNAQWRQMRDHEPELWADAVEFDRAIRDGGVRKLPEGSQAFLHRSCLPLDQAPIDRVTAKEWADRQIDIFDAIADIELLENGPADGCSPYGCRSGEPVIDVEVSS